MIILNFSHPLTENQLARAAELAAQPVDAVFYHLALDPLLVSW